MNRGSLLALLAKGKAILEKSGNEFAQVEAEFLLTCLTGYKKHEIYLNEIDLPEKDLECKFLDMIDKRCQGMPVQYASGVETFMGYKFFLDRNTLIPRSDTEFLVFSVLDFAKKRTGKLRILDLCTGSGNIAISLAKILEDSSVTAIDISEGAIEIAKSNALLNEVSDKVEFLVGDLFQPLQKDCRFDVIVSNPPYIRSEEISSLQPEIKFYEPKIALDGGDDGLKFYRSLVSLSHSYLSIEGLLAMEIGYDQALEITRLLEQEEKYKDIEVKKDLGGFDRVVLAIKR